MAEMPTDILGETILKNELERKKTFFARYGWHNILGQQTF